MKIRPLYLPRKVSYHIALTGDGTKLSWRTVWFVFLLLMVMRGSIYMLHAAPFNQAQATTVATFESLSIYWKPAGGSVDRKALVRYREQGAAAWQTGYPLWFSTHAMPSSGKWIDYTQYDRQYRGSIVHLQPGTTYEIALTLEGTSSAETFTATTWSDEFPGCPDN